jgi:putative ABC transport system permease protein
MDFRLLLDRFGRDVRFALRQLRGSPGFTLVALTTLALGIGANGAMFALADATLLKPLPFPDPERLVMMWSRAGGQNARAALFDLNDWSERNRAFEGLAGFQPATGFGPVMVAPDGTPEVVPRQAVTARFFEVLGVQPIAGRTFLPSDVVPAPNVVVVSETFWRTRLDSDPQILGRALRLSGQSLTVIGVVPAAFQLQGQSSIWTLLPPPPPNRRALRFLQVIGRLKPDVTFEAAQSDMTRVAEGLARDFPESNKDRGVAIEPLREALIGGELRLTSLLFLGVVAFVLLMCCANMAHLLLARATVRVREMALRSAVGAGRGRLAAQLLTESFVLTIVGGLLGVAVGAAILSAAPRVLPEGLLPGAVVPAFDFRVAAFCAVTALVVGVLFGLAPVWHTMGLSLAHVIKGDGRSSTSRGGRFRNLLVVGEVATAVILLCGAGLLLRTLMAVETFDHGYRAQGVLTMSVGLPVPIPTSRYPTAEALRRFYDAVERDVTALPGVRAVAWASTLPLGPSQIGSFAFEVVGGERSADESRRPLANYQIVSPSYFRTVDLPIVAGRGFDETDATESTPVCIVNEAFVRRHAGGQNPIGMRIAIRPMAIGQAEPVVREIVGVARQVKGRPDEPEDFIQVYVPLSQNAWSDAFLVVQPTGPAAGIVPAIRRAIGRVDAAVPVMRVLSLEDIASEATARHRFRAVMVSTFAGLALLLAMVGVFGVLAYSVRLRWREFGVRIALGATPTSVLRAVFSSAARVTAVGVVIGLVAAALLGRSIASFLFGVQPVDLVTFAGVIVVLAITAALASAAPALRASRTDPTITFRAD